MKLNEAIIRGITWAGKDQRITDGNGLQLLVRKASKTWLYRKRSGGKATIKTLGHWPDLSLRKARAQAAQLSLETFTESTLVSDLITDYLKTCSHLKSAFKTERYLIREVLPVIGHRKVQDVTARELAVLLTSYGKRAPRSADQLKGHLKRLFAYSIELGHRGDNPGINLSSRLTGYRSTSRDRILSTDEIRALMSDTNPKAKVLQFQLLTSVRINEALLGHREGDKWIIPATLAKNGRYHWVYLTEAASGLLPLPDYKDNTIMAYVRKSQTVPNKYRSHDVRRTAATLMNDAGVAPHIVERVLNHSLQGVMAVYNRAEYERERIEAARVLSNTVAYLTQ